jgi:hypothetical protein
MKRIFLSAALIVGLAAAGATAATADTPGNPPAPTDAPPPGPGPWPHGPGTMMPHPGMPGGWPPHGPGMWRHHDDMFSLFTHVQNKNLTPADVKIIAEAILLEHGNHSWIVTNVTETNKQITFSFATQHGDTIATFSVDPTTGHIHRVS